MFKALVIILLCLIVFNTLATMLFLFSLVESIRGKKHE